VCAARFEAALPELRLTVQTHVSGAPLSSPAAVAEEAGELLALLHGSPPDGLRIRRPGDQLAAAAASARLVSRLVPRLSRRLEVLLADLERSTPDAGSLVPAHGDFHARQLLQGGDGLCVTDFDSMCLAPAALDLATYPAHLVRGGEDDLDEARAVLVALVEGYGTEPQGLSWYLATGILRRGPRPFRFLDERWPERVEAMVDAAEAVAPR
jgi:Ser/Thr protein kinase RdoA (MazF antagonist)